MADKANEVYQLINGELVSMWGYLATYAELFEHIDPRRRELLNSTAPGFFALVQSALIECCLLRLARLMDLESSGRKKQNQNLSFDRLLQADWQGINSEPVSKIFLAVKNEWENGKYKPLDDHRNKVLAHNDLPTIQNDPLSVSTKLTQQEICLLKELFAELWIILARAHALLANASLIEPQFDSIENHPTAIFHHLKSSLFLDVLASELLDDESSNFYQRWEEFEYSTVGSEAPMRLIEN